MKVDMTQFDGTVDHAGLETTQKHYNQAAWATRALLRASFDAAGRSR